MGFTAPHKTNSCGCIAAVLDQVQGDKRLAVRVYDAEAVALRIGKDYVVGVWRSFAPMHLGGSQSDQALDLSGLVVCVQVQVNAWWYMEF